MAYANSLSYSLSYPKSRDAIASKNTQCKKGFIHGCLFQNQIANYSKCLEDRYDNFNISNKTWHISLLGMKKCHNLLLFVKMVMALLETADRHGWDIHFVSSQYFIP